MIGDIRECQVNTGWHVNNYQILDSNSIHGIPQGLKFSMKTYLFFSNPYGGRMLVTYKMTGFSEDEEFRILINGILQYSSSENTHAYKDGLNLEPTNEK